MITRDVTPQEVADLATTPPRTALSAVVADQLVLLPVRAQLDGVDPAHAPRIVVVPPGTPDLGGCDVVLVSDDGPQWFRLRSLTIRGTASAIGDGAYRITPRRVVAWDYGALRDDPAIAEAMHRHNSSRSVTTDLPRPVPMTDREILDASRVMILASRSAKGTAFAVPLWFVVDRGHICAGTSASSWSVRNVSVCPQVAVLFGGERGCGAERMLVRGRARAETGMPPPAMLAQIASRYYLHPRFLVDELRHLRLWRLRARYYGQAHSAYVVISPQSALAMDLA